MPAKPSPRTYECQTCRWKRTVAPQSDALRPNEHFSYCPVCKSGNIQLRPARRGEMLMLKISGVLSGQR
ncbi:hypothetical protein CLD22_16795 [Rubrivivax gelatinosus]|nr:hypothetical protein [Rubrivivax gelatinosus]